MIKKIRLIDKCINWEKIETRKKCLIVIYIIN